MRSVSSSILAFIWFFGAFSPLISSIWVGDTPPPFNLMLIADYYGGSFYVFEPWWSKLLFWLEYEIALLIIFAFAMAPFIAFEDKQKDSAVQKVKEFSWNAA